MNTTCAMTTVRSDSRRRHRQTEGQLAVFVAHALYRPGSSLDTVEDRRANVVGYVTASVPSDTIVDEMISQAGSDVRLQVTDGATALGSTPQMPDGGHRIQVVGGGRPWVVTLQRPAPHHTNALLGAAATLLAAGAVGLALAAQPAQDAGVALQRPFGAGAGSAQRAPRRGRITRPDGRRDRHLCAGGSRRSTRRRRARRSGAPRRTGAPRHR